MFLVCTRCLSVIKVGDDTEVRYGYCKTCFDAFCSRMDTLEGGLQLQELRQEGRGRELPPPERPAAGIPVSSR
jgi:hypothetical protein